MTQGYLVGVRLLTEPDLARKHDQQVLGSSKYFFKGLLNRVVHFLCQIVLGVEFEHEPVLFLHEHHTYIATTEVVRPFNMVSLFFLHFLQCVLEMLLLIIEHVRRQIATRWEWFPVMLRFFIQTSTACILT